MVAVITTDAPIHIAETIDQFCQPIAFLANNLNDTDNLSQIIVKAPNFLLVEVPDDARTHYYSKGSNNFKVTSRGRSIAHSFRLHVKPNGKLYSIHCNSLFHGKASCLQQLVNHLPIVSGGARTQQQQAANPPPALLMVMIGKRRLTRLLRHPFRQTPPIPIWKKILLASSNIWGIRTQLRRICKHPLLHLKSPPH